MAPFVNIRLLQLIEGDDSALKIKVAINKPWAEPSEGAGALGSIQKVSGMHRVASHILDLATDLFCKKIS